MTGHIRRRGKRSWELKFDVGTDPMTGKRKVRFASFKGTKREAEIELARLITSSHAGDYVDPSKLSVSDFLDKWLGDWARTNLGGSTFEQYELLLRLHVRPNVAVYRCRN